MNTITEKDAETLARAILLAAETLDCIGVLHCKVCFSDKTVNEEIQWSSDRGGVAAAWADAREGLDAALAILAPYTEKST